MKRIWSVFLFWETSDKCMLLFSSCLSLPPFNRAFLSRQTSFSPQMNTRWREWRRWSTWEGMKTGWMHATRRTWWERHAQNTHTRAPAHALTAHHPHTDSDLFLTVHQLKRAGCRLCPKAVPSASPAHAYTRTVSHTQTHNELPHTQVETTCWRVWNVEADCLVDSLLQNPEVLNTVKKCYIVTGEVWKLPDFPILFAK